MAEELRLKKISDLPIADTVGDNDVLVGVQEGVTKRFPRSILKQAGAALNIKDFGEVGNGQDAYPAMQALINAIAGTGRYGLIPEGEYPLSDTVICPTGDFTLSLSKGAYIKRDFSTSPKGFRTLFSVNASLSEFPTAYLKGIVIDGGIWDLQSQAYGAGNTISGLGNKGLWISRAEFLNVEDAHALDLACFDGVYVADCKFKGYRNGAGDRAYSEAIQLDPAAGFPSAFSDTWNSRNFTAERNYFGPNPERTEPGWGSWGGGIGNHALAYDGSGVALGGIHKNIYIRNNIFDSCVVHAVRPLGWRNTCIEENEMICPASSSGVLIEHGFVRPADGSVPENFKIVRNNMVGAGIFVNVPNPPDGQYVTEKKHLKNLIIESNTFKRTSGSAALMSLSWVQGLKAFKNEAEATGGTFITSRFLADARIAYNYESGCSSFLYVTEVGAEYIGLGNTRNINIIGNIAKGGSGRSIHINGACQGGAISNHQMEDVANAGGLPAIVVDTNARGFTFIDNKYRKKSSSSVLPTFGILAGGLDHFIGINDFGELTIPVSYGTASAGTGRVAIAISGDTPNSLIAAPTSSTCQTSGSAPGFWVKTSASGLNTGWQKLAFA